MRPVKAGLTPVGGDESAALDAVRIALARAGISNKEAAIVMEKDPGQWSRELSGKEHMKLQPLMKLGPVFWREFVIARAIQLDMTPPSDPTAKSLAIQRLLALIAGAAEAIQALEMDR